MDRLSIEKAMIKNMIEKTGKPIEEWIKIIKEKYFVGHGGIVKFLKEQNSLTHGYANLIAWKSK
jgi:hypothetical protein|tara:strand:- start:280 stop:471 length:192 start_codon:yes stop_codon:yes gene_type:complete